MNFVDLQVACRCHDITLPGLAVLQEIIETPQPLGKLAEKIKVTSSSLTQVSDTLEKEGLVERKPGLSDRRQVFLFPTMFGREVFDQMISAGTQTPRTV